MWEEAVTALHYPVFQRVRLARKVVMRKDRGGCDGDSNGVGGSDEEGKERGV